MKRRSGILALILIVTASLAWHNQQQLAAGRAARTKLLDQAAAQGMSVDPEHPASLMLAAKLPRPSREEETKRIATSLMAYMDEMRPMDRRMDSSDPALRDKITQQMDQLAGLDADQWEQLIHEVFTASDHPASYQGLLGLAFHQLVKDRPAEALTILLETPGMLEAVSWIVPHNVISEAVRNMLAADRQAALEWFTENRTKWNPELWNSSSYMMIQEVARGDARLALKLVDDFKMEQPENLVPAIFRMVRVESRNEALAVFREWQAARQMPSGSGLQRDVLEALAFRSGSDTYEERVGFAGSSAWMDQADLTAEERDILGESLINRIQVKDGGQAMEWLAAYASAGTVKHESPRIFSSWLVSDYKAAGDWLTDHPDFPGRAAMAREYVEKVSRRDPELAGRFAQDLPKEAPEESAEGGVGVGVSVGEGAVDVFKDDE